MTICPKCSQQYDDPIKICRRCGAILETVKEESPVEAVEAKKTPALPPRITPPPPVAGKRSWSCPKCRQPVPNTFEVCWNCGTSRDGLADPHFEKEPAEDVVEAIEVDPSEPETPGHSTLPCPRCGSSQIIPQVRMVDYMHPDGALCAVVYGNPDAQLFKKGLMGQLAAEICRECGHVELRVENPKELYERYLQALER
ncbi:MAG: zinc ribbon domain-containing protein [Pirellulales bacterium]|nr:zinc ribbon domain-containing protein [Pirellulales bacterium]